MMRRILLALLLIASGAASATGVPVVDVAGLAQAVEQVKTLADQLETLKQQYETAKSQLASLQEQAQTMKSMYTDLSGVTGQAQMLGDSVKNWHNFIPSGWSDPSAMANGELSGLVEQLRGKQEKYTAGVLFPAANQAAKKDEYQAWSDYAFSYTAQAQQALQGFTDRRATLESLGTAVAAASTPKATLDIIARATAENSLLLNDIAQMLALQLRSAGDREILEHNAEGLRNAQGTRAADIRFSAPTQ